MIMMSSYLKYTCIQCSLHTTCYSVSVGLTLVAEIHVVAPVHAEVELPLVPPQHPGAADHKVEVLVVLLIPLLHELHCLLTDLCRLCLQVADPCCDVITQTSIS